MRKKVKQLIGSLVLLLICIVSASLIFSTNQNLSITQAGATMNSPTAVRLGKVDAGKKETKNAETKKENTAAPIILWSKDAAAAALYLTVEADFDAGTVKQTIDFLVPPARGVKERLKSFVGAYPITHSAHGQFDEKAKRQMNNIVEIYTKDVNGDGIDELILTHSLGDIEVYDREKRILKYKPKSNPKLYGYKVNRSFTKLDDHDEIFFAVEQYPYDSENATARDTWIVRVSPAGITEIHPVFPDHSKPETIVSAVGMNKPGSRIVDELVVISKIKDKKGTYLSRHKLDGTGIDAPREIYTDYSIYCNPYGLSGSNQLIIFNVQDKMLYFVTPDKPVNWIKTIDIIKLFGSDADFNAIGETQINNLAVLVLENHGKLYALDAQGKFHTSMKPDSHTSDKPVAFMTLKADSNKHTIIMIEPTDKTMESYLVIQSRDPGKRELTTEELEKAGKRFLTDDKWKTCREELRLDYNDYMQKKIKWYCEENKIPIPKVQSLEEVKKKLPGYYDKEVKQSQESYHSALETRLFFSIEEGGSVPEEGDFKNIEEYKKWLESVFVAPELVFSIQHISKGNIGHQRLTDYYFKALAIDIGLTSQPAINVRANGEHGRAFMALHKKLLNQNEIKPAYYTIAW